MPQILLQALIASATKLFMSFATQEMMEWLLFYIADKLVKSTKTTVDDEFYAKLKSIYDESK